MDRQGQGREDAAARDWDQQLVSSYPRTLALAITPYGPFSSSSAYWNDSDALDAWEYAFAVVLEAMARLDHPDAEAVLTMIGRHASDKTTAKAARRAAYKASTRRAARR